LTGLVRDKQGRKMSKQLGNSPDALKLIEDFGADAVRVGLLFSSAAGNDLLFYESLCQQGKSFANKIWNAYRLIDGWEVDENRNQSTVNQEALQWYGHRFQQTLETINDHFDKYRLSDALMTSYRLIWDDFCSWLLEAIKPAYGDPIDGKTLGETRTLFEQNLKLLHPFMPFLTEEIWHDMADRSQKEALIISKWPEFKSFDLEIINRFDKAKSVIGGIRNFRKEKQIGFKETLVLQVIGSTEEIPFESLVQKMGQLARIDYLESSSDKTGGAFRANGLEFFIPLEGKVDIEKERQKLDEELKYLNGFLISVQKKLANERFVSNAPEQVLANERKKEADALEKIEVLQKSLAAL
jgi:valyl-tRNA synthetase